MSSRNCLHACMMMMMMTCRAGQLSWLSAMFLGLVFLDPDLAAAAACSSPEAQTDCGPRELPSRMRLFQYHPIEVGHERYVEIEPGRYVRMKTLAMDPPLFEIPNFLTQDECSYIKTLALESGLEISRTAAKGSQSSESDMTSSMGTEGGHGSDWYGRVAECDEDADSMLDPEEAVKCLPELRALNVSASVLDLMMGDLDLDRDSDARLDAHELRRITELPSVAEDIRRWMERWWEDGERLVKKWKGRARISDQTWLSSIEKDRSQLRTIQDRLIALTKMPREVVHTSEALQVVRYRPGGYYHAHYDTDDLSHSLECRHTAIVFNGSAGRPFAEERCRFCRMITVLYYLNDVEEGGETAFPFADTYPDTQQYEAKLRYDYTDLTEHCQDSSLVVKAEKGKAVLWYNHNIDPESGWLGGARGHSLHGGCGVKRGVKWIANNWISVDDNYDRQLKFLDAMKPFLQTTSTVSGPPKELAPSQGTPCFASRTNAYLGEETDTRASHDDLTADTSDHLKCHRTDDF